MLMERSGENASITDIVFAHGLTVMEEKGPGIGKLTQWAGLIKQGQRLWGRGETGTRKSAGTHF